MAEKKTREKRLEELSKKLGDITNVCLNAFTEELVHTVKKTHDYIVTVAFEVAEGKFVQQSDGDVDWETPEGFGNYHVEIIVQDRDDKRFVPYLDVHVRVYDADNNLVTESDAPFMWHPYLYHYGFDTPIPEEGRYTVEVQIKAPKFDRHHKSHGKRYVDDVTTRLSAVQLMPIGGNDDDDIMNQ